MFAFLSHSWRCETGQHCVPFVYFPSGLPRRSLLLPNLSSLTFVFLQNASKLTLFRPRQPLVAGFYPQNDGILCRCLVGTSGMDVWRWQWWGARGWLAPPYVYLCSRNQQPHGLISFTSRFASSSSWLQRSSRQSPVRGTLCFWQCSNNLCKTQPPPPHKQSLSGLCINVCALHGPP